MDRLKLNNKKEFYIDLDENKYYFPGDLVKGTVVLNLDKTAKTNHIRITLTGQVNAEGSSNSSSTTTSSSTSSGNNNNIQILALPSLYVAKAPINKTHVLAAQSHRFPFEFQLPTKDPLPSSLKLKKNRIRYMLTAVHDRPLVPGILARQTKKELRVLERIDITRPEYGARSHVVKSVTGDEEDDGTKKKKNSNSNRKKKNIKAGLTLPRYAVVRGDILPLEIQLDHYRGFAREEAIKIELIRRIYNGKNRCNMSEQKSIKTFMLGIKIPENTCHQTIHTKLSIPTDTPPTVSSESGRILAVDYAIRATINLNDPLFSLGTLTTYRQRQQYIVNLESNLLVGTYPLPNVSIDDDNDDDDDDDAVSEDEADDRSTKPSITSSTSSTTTSTAHIVEPTRNASAATVIDPTLMKKMNIQTSSPRRQSIETRRHNPQQLGPSSLTVIDPTMMHPKRHSITTMVSPLPDTRNNAATINKGATTVIDPTHRPQHSWSTSSGSVTTIEPGRRYDLNYNKPDHSRLPHRPMASMPDMSAYVPIKGNRPTLYNHHALHHHQQQQPRYPPSSPGGFIVPPQPHTYGTPRPGH
ncbi:hypothetical protein BC941DRAFT_506167 [Chlamydoabsidia padenii]|nr:hypothetical protein BC941DRAFT_506167 [Chlamydoabsidia padenii]